jgi:hypothetical protein
MDLMEGDETVGQLLQRGRVAKGLSREGLARELKLPLRHLEAIEADDWAALPPGRPRPLTRQLALRLGVDLDYYADAFQTVPGVRVLDPPDPRQERLERVVPGPRLGRKSSPSYLAGLPRAALPPPPPPSTAPYPVLGELLPEAPLNEQGILVSLRAMDACEVRLEAQADSGTPPLARTLRVSEPWKLRVKGAFSLFLDNAGVVNVEVAGLRIPHGQSVGETWTGRFDAEGHWLKPAPPVLPEEPPVPDDEEEGKP